MPLENRDEKFSPIVRVDTSHTLTKDLDRELHDFFDVDDQIEVNIAILLSIFTTIDWPGVQGNLC
jgi:hypothetical protein